MDTVIIIHIAIFFLYVFTVFLSRYLTLFLMKMGFNSESIEMGTIYISWFIPIVNCLIIIISIIEIIKMEYLKPNNFIKNKLNWWYGKSKKKI